MRRPRRGDEPVKSVAAGSRDAAAGKPSADLLLQSCRVGLAWQRLLGKLGPERGFRRSLKRDHGEEIQNLLAMPPSRPARPLIALQQNGRYADLTSQMGNHRRCEVGCIFGKSRILFVKGELDGEAELAGVSLARQQSQLLRSKRPTLNQLLG